MHHFKHAELVNQYHVSLKTVHNWIDAAKQGKLELQLHEQKSRTYVANTPHNTALLEKLATDGKKYRNSRFHQVVTPASAFYDLFSRKQILDMINSLSVHREIPRQYNYFDQGAVNWDTFATRMSQETGLNMLKGSQELLHANLGAIDLLLENYARVNVIDIGPGNALPSRELLGHLLERGILHRYIAIDISQEMLHIAERNIRKWFGDRIKFEGYVKDITHERFDDLLVDDMLDRDAETTVNLAVLLGATPMNFREPADTLKVICSSLGQEDLLVYTDKPDSEAERRSFNFHPSPGSNTLSPNHRFIFNLWNIDDSLYDVEMGFNERRRVRYIQVRLKKALTFTFKFKNGERHVDLNKGETILLWRVWHLSALEIISDFEKAGFSLMHASMTKDRQYLLTISGVNTKSETGS
ncbi:MAG TPA: L-histidine N(alpha)-methyltransferase [Candidatus Saccharimonadales bacterium]|nr:L-histidine N(alpha)-methyltransferase [Candidatus Saccharimonadales bacterium]